MSVQDAAGATSGMGGGGYYDVHSEYQRRVIGGGHELIRSLLASVDLDTVEGQFVIADYGAGTGATSVDAMGVAIDAIRERARDVPVLAVHNDVVTSDFTQLFRNIASPEGYLATEGAAIFPTAAGGSFFAQVVPDSSVHLGMCSNASHWYREQPSLDVPGGIFFSEAGEGSRRALADQAADDWLRFLGARAAELVPGGHLLVQGIGTKLDPDGDELVSARDLLLQMSAVVDEMAADGMLEREALERYVFPVYCRSRAEAEAPVVEGGALAGSLALRSAKVEEVPNPYWELLEADGDRTAYAAAYTAFIRAFSESTLFEHLFAPAALGVEPDAVCDEFFARFEAATAANPDRGRYRA